MLKAEKRIRETIREHSLIQKGDHIVIGLSGGPDSVCLFDVLAGMADELDLTIHPVHVNHKFRPGDAEEDQRYVEELSERYGMKAGVFTVDCNAMAEDLGMTSEEAGRKARYDAFFQTAAEVASQMGGRETAAGRVKIAVAHNANDQAETVLFRILRGTGMDGVAGMSYARAEKRGEDTFMVVRPLLDTWRKDIEAYCEERTLDPVTDHTNNEELYARNRIRLDLIPYIEEKYNTNFQEGLVRMARIAAADKEFFWEKTACALERLRLEEDEDMISLEWRGLAGCHEALRHRVIMKAFEEIGLTKDITAERIASADKIILGKVGGKTVEFPHGYSLSVGKGAVKFNK